MFYHVGRVSLLVRAFQSEPINLLLGCGTVHRRTDKLTQILLGSWRSAVVVIHGILVILASKLCKDRYPYSVAF